MHDMKVVIDAGQIQARVKELAAEIETRFEGEPLVLVCVLKGAFIFFADLVRHLSCCPELDFIRLASYGADKESSGKVLFSKDMEVPVKGKHVVVVEDIVDTGRSMRYLEKVLAEREPRTVSICALVDKHERREVEVEVDFPGFRLKKGFIVGYGMDYAEKYRELPGIYEIIS